MNIAYTYIDGNVIIFDEKGNQIPTEYYDNLDKVLVQENIIEVIEKRIQKLEANKLKTKKRFIPTSIFIGIIVWFIAINFIPSLFNIYLFLNTIEMSLITLIASIIFGIILDCQEYRHYKNNLKKEMANTCELEFLKDKLVEEKQKLESLKKEKSKENEDSAFRVVKVNDVEKLKQLKHSLELYRKLGYDLKKLYKYLENGTLEKKLNKYYSNNDVELARQFLEENGPKLIKRINN